MPTDQPIPPVKTPPPITRVPHFVVDEPDPSGIHVLVTGFGVSVPVDFPVLLIANLIRQA